MSALNNVVFKIHQSASTQNLYKNLTQGDRIALESSPLSNNYTGSAGGLIRSLTPMHLQALDVGRSTYASIAQEENCQETCMKKCISQHHPFRQCRMICSEHCVTDVRKDYV